jgi:hypothetical protein
MVRRLKTEFLSKGFSHKQISRENDIAIFSRTKDGNEHFEVVRIRLSRPHPFDESPDNADWIEVYPSNEQWGSHGFRGFGNNGTKSPVKPLVQPRKCRLRFGTGCFMQMQRKG